MKGRRVEGSAASWPAIIAAALNLAPSPEPSALSLIPPLHVVAVAEQQLADLQVALAAEALGHLLRVPQHRLPRARQPVAGGQRRGGAPRSSSAGS